MKVLQVIERCKDFFGINCTVKISEFNQYKIIPRTLRGVYVLEDELGNSIYVGKGNIQIRQDSHWFKAHGTPKKHQIYPKGWKWLRENYQVNPDKWTVYYIGLDKETHLSAMEGSLIHFLQPLANDETFKDENRILNG